MVRLLRHFMPRNDTENRLAVRYVINVLYEHKILIGSEPLIAILVHLDLYPILTLKLLDTVEVYYG
jgi:uncharacterized membrane protein